MNDNILKDASKEVQKLLKDKKNKTAVLGAGLGYLVSENNKERNALIGATLGYFLSSSKDKDEEDNE